MLNRQRAFFLIIITSCLLLCACGFHLRSYQESLRHVIPVILLKPSGTPPFYQRLRYSLLARSIEVVEATPSSDRHMPQLSILSEELLTFPLVYGPEGDLRRERLKFTVEFSYCDKEETNTFTLSTERDRQLIPRQRLGDDSEKVIIEREMQMDIIQQLLRYLAMHKGA
jgi:outer membrane lipopolysaccharide assembly protein LptE/RlpB